ncbi:DNA-directed DNA polymerase [Lobosporangium transversale]|uniref:DNA polymerase phi-domain-containing protein n=1 Tax=Lobosporangium transversale TaxID=64571 RepID=A0A1Y2GWA0_9FUNG|nr:DNA polymerase phi-domain-containing protein [Lobosporangium transversale]KAF9906499.1 DNA-directed DNA polymerase [Lobosporangium transversale]ORZ26545.1 DNA polymerase phi-domain-containing protein [Lobosporangium transversale]|eukprot:XP_021884310.1 DNA polymerase phi-domain-containing protein [Lobosporangium transversale]
MSQPHLPLFGILASLDVTERNAAALTLIKALAVLQNSHSCDLDPTKEDIDITEKTLDILCHPDVVYALKRLIRGLPSDREAARQGFSLALTELLIGLNFLTVKIVLELLFRFTEIKNFMKGKEERNHMFGRIFGFMSIIQSGMLTRPRTTDEDIKLIIDDLVEYSREKSYLSEVCHQVLVMMLPQIINHPKSVKYIVDTVFAEGVNTPDELNVAMVLKEHLDQINSGLSKEDQINWTRVLGKSWKNPIILHPSNLKYLGLLLKEASTEEGTQPSSNWRQNLHPVWDRILAQYFNNANNVSVSQIAPFRDFWNVVIDSTLFDSSSSHERKYWGFQIFERVLPVLDEDQLPLIFTTNFMRCFVNNLASEDRFLNKAAKHTMAAMHARADTNEAVRLTLITQLLDKNPNFDRMSRSKTVETLLGGLDVTHIKDYLQYLTKAFVEQETSESNSVERGKRVDVSRQWTIDQMFSLFRNPKVPREEGWIKSILEFYLVHAFFEIKKADSKNKYAEAHRLPSPPLSGPTRESCRGRFYSMMAELSTMAPLAAKRENEETEAINYSRKLNGTMVDGTFWCSYALNMMVDLEKNKNFQSLVTLGDDAAKAKKTALALVGKIQERSKKASKGLKAQYKAFELLFVQMILQLYIEPEDSTNILGELHDCYDKVFGPSSKSKKANGKTSAQDEDGEDEEEIQPVEVIVDILLSFLIKPSALLRHVSEQVFVIFCDKMTKTGLELMLSTLQTKDNKDDMFGEENDEEDEDEDAEADAHNQSGEEEEEEEEEEEGEGEEDDDEDEEETEDMDVDEEEDDEPVDEEFRKKLAAALNMKDGGEDEESSDEELLDDDQMMAFDEKLNEIFRQKKLAKAQQKDAKQTLVHFKNKVLDLLELYIKKQSSNELVLELVVPLLSLVVTPSAGNMPIHDKIVSLLRNKLAKIKDYPREYDEEHVFEILSQVHELAKKSPDGKSSSLCGELSLLLVKVLIGGQDEKTAVGETKVERTAVSTGKRTRGMSKKSKAAAEVDPEEAALKAKQDRVIGLYSASLKEFMTRKHSNLSAKMFLEFIDRFPHLAWHLSSTLLEYTSPKAVVKTFRQTMAFTMLAALVKRLANKNTPEFEPLFLETVPLIRNSLIETFEGAFVDVEKNEATATAAARGLNVARLREILKFAILSARMAKRSENRVKEIWQTEKMGPLLQRISEDGRFNSGALRSLIQQMLVLIESEIKLMRGSVKKQEKQEKRKRALEAQANGSSKKKAHRSKKRKVATTKSTTSTLSEA